ncbi:MAG: energy-coupling factor ABC transporter ATP-binding protein, partial [Chloroflexi bacterium]|nr:energy-coupling factor ABC transporter ATP-binding protein [Chloroflexota bacterium]
VPPVVALGKALKLAVLPLSLDEARQAIQSMAVPALPRATAHAPRAGEGMTARLAFTAVRAGYNGRTVLRDVNLTVGAGEVVALMGHNGAGKSTLLKCAVGLLKPTSGDIRVNDVPVVGRDTWEVCRDVAYLPQNPNALLFADAVRDELNATLANHGLLGQKDVDAMLARLGLERYAGAYPRDLSVGERERVAVGAVTVTEPGLLLLDEPTRGLDYAAKRALTDLLRGWKAEGAGILLVTHDVEFVAECVDRVVLMADGRIVADGAPAQVLADSPVFAPQIAQVFPGTGWLTVDDAVKHIMGRIAIE